MRGRLTSSGNFANIAQLLFPDLPRHGHGNLPSGQSEHDHKNHGDHGQG